MAMRSRCTLHKSKLATFQAFCEARGWVAEPSKGDYEVLRMRHPERRDPMIVHERSNATEHYTTSGESQKQVRAFIRATSRDTEVASVLRQKDEEIDKLRQWNKRQLDELERLRSVIAAKDIELHRVGDIVVDQHKGLKEAHSMLIQIWGYADEPITRPASREVLSEIRDMANEFGATMQCHLKAPSAVPEGDYQ